jgi:hypothetical protein
MSLNTIIIRTDSPQGRGRKQVFPTSLISEFIIAQGYSRASIVGNATILTLNSMDTFASLGLVSGSLLLLDSPIESATASTPSSSTPIVSFHLTIETNSEYQFYRSRPARYHPRC